jgi:hypothetical protein
MGVIVREVEKDRYFEKPLKGFPGGFSFWSYPQPWLA